MAEYYEVPGFGEQTAMEAGGLKIPDQPIIPFIEGDGTGRDIWRATVRVLDAAVEKAYGGKRKIAWTEVLAGEKAFNETGEWLPQRTLDFFRQYLIGIKGPLTTPVGGGIRSLNVALRQLLDLYVCLRPVRYFEGTPSPARQPELVDMVIFRENTEDIYAGVEWYANTPECKQVLDFLMNEMGVKKIRFPDTTSLGIKPVSREGSQRLIKAAFKYALRYGRKSISMVHKGNIMKFTEGGFRDWGYELSQDPELRDKVVTQREAWALENKERNSDLSVRDNAKLIEPWFDQLDADKQAAIVTEVEGALELWPTHGEGKWKELVLLKDNIADITLQQVQTRPTEFDIIATMNLNGDYISDALAAQVGGLGIAPGANINYETGHAIFEATHGTAPKYADKDQVNPGSLILSGALMFQYMGWEEAQELIYKGLGGAIQARTVTYDFHRLMLADGLEAKKLKCSEFGDAMISHMDG